MVGVNYSQSEEQAHILEAVGHLATGRFLDIGAFHPTSLSNTRALFELGWEGVLVEPSPEPFAALLREYGTDPRITLLCAAAGIKSDIVRFHATADAVTTSSEESYLKWQKVGGFYGTFYAPVVPLVDILTKFGAFDFVSIDTEGTSTDLFAELLRLPMRPQCICVEHDGRLLECHMYAAAAGYSCVYQSSENGVYGQL